MLHKEFLFQSNNEVEHMCKRNCGKRFRKLDNPDVFDIKVTSLSQYSKPLSFSTGTGG